MKIHGVVPSSFQILPNISISKIDHSDWAAATKKYSEKKFHEISEEESLQLVDFFEELSVRWIPTRIPDHPIFPPSHYRAEEDRFHRLLRMVSLCYLITGNREIQERIEKVVLAIWKEFSLSFSDMILKVQNKTSLFPDSGDLECRISALVLSAHSPYFAKLLRSGFKEGRGMREQYGMQDSQPLPSIAVEGVSAEVFQVFVEIMKGADISLRGWTKEELFELARYAEMTETLGVVLPRLPIHTLLPESARDMYEFLNELSGTEGLQEVLLQRLVDLLGLEDDRVFDCFDRGKIPHFDFLKSEEAKYVCSEYLLARLPYWLSHSDSTWNEEQKIFKSEKNTLEKMRGFFKKPEDESALHLKKLNRFAKIVSQIQRISRPLPKNLLSGDLEWLLKHISERTYELNLEWSRLGDRSHLLKRFQNTLQILSLANSSDRVPMELLGSLQELKKLDVSKCPLLLEVTFVEQLHKLEYLNLSNNPHLRDLSPLRKSTSLREVDLKDSVLNAATFATLQPV